MRLQAVVPWLLGFGWQAFVFMACLAALADLQRPVLRESGEETRDAARRIGLRWRNAALLLILLMALLHGGLAGPAGLAAFLAGPPGAVWLVEAGMLAIVVRAGAAWAAVAGRNPFVHEGPLPGAKTVRDQAVRPEKQPRSATDSGLRRWPWTEWLALLFLMHGWTLLLARLIPHVVQAALPARLGLAGLSPWLIWPLVVAMLTLAPILEEILFRHYLLYRLAWLFRLGPAPGPAAVVLTSLVFAIGHFGTIEPWWLKLIQTFGLGLMLGGLAWRHGLAPAIALHWVFNLSLIVFAMLR